ncbi:winged helix-turn-helix domain-containing protein [Nitrobacter sp.]|uniref:winged helix-turn-helix domain-containing protein n=1 Tax=Nitrobacter sp. TaxID=29420 RepID=UPI00399D6421
MNASIQRLSPTATHLTKGESAENRYAALFALPSIFRHAGLPEDPQIAIFDEIPRDIRVGIPDVNGKNHTIFGCGCAKRKRRMPLNTFLRLEFTKPAAYCSGIGGYIASLLEAVATFGSVSAAARVMKADPPFLRRMVRCINEDFGGIIVLKRGRSGGAFVTGKGLALLQQYRMIDEGIRRVFAEDLREIEKLIGSDPQMPRHLMEYDRWRQLSPPKTENSKRRAQATKSTIVNSVPLSVHVYLALFSEKLWIGERSMILLRAMPSMDQSQPPHARRIGPIIACRRGLDR